MSPPHRISTPAADSDQSRSLPDTVNDAVRNAFDEDAEDLAAFEERADEPLISYEELLKELKEEGLL